MNTARTIATISPSGLLEVRDVGLGVGREVEVVLESAVTSGLSVDNAMLLQVGVMLCKSVLGLFVTIDDSVVRPNVAVAQGGEAVLADGVDVPFAGNVSSGEVV